MTVERRSPIESLRPEVKNALFLDFDGTLVDIAQTPESVVVPRGLVPLLVGLHEALDGALAIVTGRSIADIDAFLHPARFVVAGLHGGEYRTSREEVVRPAALPIDPGVVEAIRALEAIAPGVRVEPKGATIAVHWRNAPEAEDRVGEALARIVEGGPDHLEISRGRRVFEVCPKHISKGAAIEILSDLPAFRGRRPIMIGDDISDESAFEAAERLGGVAFRVCGETFSPKVADFETPRQVREWLSVLLTRATP